MQRCIRFGSLRRLHNGPVRPLFDSLEAQNPDEHDVLPEVISKERSDQLFARVTISGSMLFRGFTTRWSTLKNSHHVKER